jgi:hypothetical protein
MRKEGDDRGVCMMRRWRWWRELGRRGGSVDRKKAYELGAPEDTKGVNSTQGSEFHLRLLGGSGGVQIILALAIY